MAKQFEDDERAAVYRAIYERRDMRHFVKAPVDAAVLARLIGGEAWMLCSYTTQRAL